MDKGIFREFLRGIRSAKEINDLIEAEVSESKKKWMKGAAGPIQMYGDSEAFVINREHLKMIGNGFLNDIFDEWDIYYILTALELDENFSFESDEVEDAVSTLSDPIANGEITKEKLRMTISRLY